MSDFSLWFTTGLEHIVDLRGYDHILYILALTIVFQPEHWKRLLILITAFTLGHSITLAMSTLNMIRLPQPLVEIWIAVTILVSCILNLREPNPGSIQMNTRYFLAAFFGCIHGLGFSYLLKSMLGHEASILLPLLYFNTGLEAGQIIILLTVLLFVGFLKRFLPEKQKTVTTTITFVILLLSIYMLLDRLHLYLLT